MVKPLTPKEAFQVKHLPDTVIEVWNSLIAKNFKGNGTFIVKQEDAIAALINATGVDRVTVLNNNWLDIENIYQNYGWHVSYDKPAYNENYEAFFEFRPKAEPRKVVA